MDNTIYSIEQDKIIIDTVSGSDKEYTSRSRWIHLSSLNIICEAYIPVPNSHCHINRSIICCTSPDSPDELSRYHIRYTPSDGSRYQLKYSTMYEHKITSEKLLLPLMNVSVISDAIKDSMYTEYTVKLSFSTASVSRESIDKDLDDFVDRCNHHSEPGYCVNGSIVISDKIEDKKNKTYTVTLYKKESGYYLYHHLNGIVNRVSNHTRYTTIDGVWIWSLSKLE